MKMVLKKLTIHSQSDSQLMVVILGGLIKALYLKKLEKS